MKKTTQNVILRMTVNVNMDDQVETSFVRAFLQRLNILHAQTKPHDGLKAILKDGKLREHFDARRRAVVLKKATGEQSASILLGPPQKSPEKPIIVNAGHSGIKDETCFCGHAKIAHMESSGCQVLLQHGAARLCPCTRFTDKSKVETVKHEAPKVGWRITKIIERKMPLLGK